MPTPIDRQPAPRKGRAVLSALFVGLATTLCGCGGEPSRLEILNARAFEALLTAVSFKREKEVEKDAKVIDERHAAGEISDEKYQDLAEIIKKARAKDWSGAEKRACEFRSQFGDKGSFFR